MDDTASDGATPRLVWFFVLAYAITWVALLPAILGDGTLTPLAVAGYVVGAFGPSVAALVVVYRTAGRTGVRRLLGRLTVWRVPLRWWLVALFLPASLKLGTLALLVVAGHPLPAFDLGPLPMVVATMVVGGLVPGAIGEELGWRGYALPRLAARFGLAAGSVVLGVLWALWHLPTFLVGFTGQASLPAGWLLLEISAASVLYAWLVANARWSVLLAIAFHAANNALTPVLYPAIAEAGFLSTYGAATAVGYTGVALVLLARLRDAGDGDAPVAP